MSDQNQNNQSEYEVNFNKLKSIHDTMRNQRNIDIEKLVSMVDEASASYKILKGKIESVKTMLGERVPEELDKVGN